MPGRLLRTFILIATAIVSLTGCSVSSSLMNFLGNSPAKTKAVKIGIEQMTYTEGETKAVTIELNQSYDQPLMVNLLLTGPANRFQPLPLNVTIPAGSTSQTFFLTSLDDAIYQGPTPASFTLSISPVDPAWSFEGTPTVIDLSDDELMPELIITDSQANESAGNLEFTITQTRVSDFETRFKLSTIDGVATSGVDFSAIADQEFVIPAGSTSVTVPVPLIDDIDIETNKTFTASVHTPVNANILQASASGTIVNDDNVVVIQFSADMQSINENGEVVNLQVSLDQPTATNIVVPITFSGTATRNSDYTSSLDTITIPSGQTSFTQQILITNDSIYELTESIVVTLGAPSYSNASIGAQNTHTINIIEDDALPALSIANVTISEELGSATFTVVASHLAEVPMAFDWSTADGTAKQADGDYTFTAGNGIVIPPGLSQVQISLPVLDDLVWELTETLTLNFSNPVNASITNTTATLTINDNDPAPTITIIGATIPESDPSVTLTISLSNAAGAPISFDWATANSDATAGEDYTAGSGSGVIAAGFLNTTVSVNLLEDPYDEFDEIFTTTLSNVTSPVTGTLVASVAIQDNDLPPTLSIANTSEMETGRTVDILVQPSLKSGKPISFDYSTTDGTALAGTDYTASTGTYTLPAMTDSAYLSIPIDNIPKTQANRDFVVSFSNPVHVDLQTADITATIIENSPLKLPTLIKDIGLAPAAITTKVVAGKVYFINTTTTEGAELWVSDGTEAGTQLVKDIYPGATGSSITSMTEYGGMLYFAANDGTNGKELWRSDGTLAGTQMVMDIYAGSTGSSPNYLHSFGGSLYFNAQDATSSGLYVTDGTIPNTTKLHESYYVSQITSGGSYVYFTGGTSGELWKTDGTLAGTSAVYTYYDPDISSLYYAPGIGKLFFSADGPNDDEPYASNGTTTGNVLLRNIGTTYDGPSYPNGFIEVNNLVYFKARDAFAQNHYSLFSSNGTSGSGTALIVSSTLQVDSMAPIGTKLLFTATNSTYGTEVWISEGALANTVLLKDINPGAGSSGAALLGLVNGKYLFSANDGSIGTELWGTDGTEAGTTLIKDISPSGSSSIYSFSTDGTTGWFVASDGSSGAELWKTDGTTAGTVMVKDLNPGAETSAPRNLTLFGSQLFFSAYNSSTQQPNLGISDGTSAGTSLFSTKILQSSGGNLSDFTEFNSKLFFAADDGNRGSQLWSSDGTTIGTEKVIDLLPGGGCVTVSNLRVLGSSLFFVGNSSSTGSEPHLSNGTSAGTALIKDIYAGATSSGLGAPTIVFGNKIFFQANDGNGNEPWITDGTEAGTFTLGDLYTGTTSGNPNSSTPQPLGMVGSRFVFSATNSTHGWELWSTDGTPAGTTLMSIRSGSSAGISSSPIQINMGSYMIFVGNSGNGDELFKTDGTAAGTTLLKEINSGTSSSSPNGLTLLGTQVLFSATSSTQGRELWKTDGTAAGTVLLKDIVIGTGSSSPVILKANSQFVFFTANDGVNGTELWKSDGTDAGTVLVKDITPGASSSSFESSSWIVNDRLIFRVYNSLTARNELWSSDGSSSGTIKIEPTDANGVSSMVVLGNRMFMQGSSIKYGTELYVSDGTLKGTYLYDDLVPGLTSSSPASLFRLSNDRIFMKATDPQMGEELWSIPP